MPSVERIMEEITGAHGVTVAKQAPFFYAVHLMNVVYHTKNFLATVADPKTTPNDFKASLASLSEAMKTLEEQEDV